MFLLELNIYNLCDTWVHKTPLKHVNCKIKVNGHSGLTSLNFRPHLTIAAIISMAESTGVKT